MNPASDEEDDLSDDSGPAWTEQDYKEYLAKTSFPPKPKCEKPKCTRFVPAPDQPCTYIVDLKFPESGQPEHLEEWYRSFIPKDVVLEPPRWFLASNPRFHVGFCALLTLEEVEAMRKENKHGFVRAFMEGPLELD